MTRCVAVLFVAAILFAGGPLRCGAAEVTASVPNDGRRVFVMGHSFHIFVADRLTSLAKAAGICGHELAGRQMIGGSSVRQHWNLADGRNEAKARLLAGDVDVLTMSPNWLVPDDAVALFTDFGVEHQPGLQVLLQVSWMAYDHWEPASDPRLWNSELFTDPIGHGTAPVMALAAYCNFACLYGCSPVGLDDGDRALDRIHPNLGLVLQGIAWDAVTACPSSGVTKDAQVDAPRRPQAVDTR